VEEAQGSCCHPLCNCCWWPTRQKLYAIHIVQCMKIYTRGEMKNS